MAEIRRVAEVQTRVIGRQGIKCVAQTIDLGCRSGLAVNALDLETKHVNSEHALKDNHWDGRLVAGEESVEAETKDTM